VAKRDSTLNFSVLGLFLTALVVVVAVAWMGGNEKAPAASSSATFVAKLPGPLAASRGRVFYVATSGKDSNPGSRTRPWRTVQRALDKLKSGQRALVRRGTYVQDLEARRAGTARAPITIMAMPGQRVVLRAASTSGDTYPIRITTGAAFLRIRGFVLERAKGTSSTNVYFEGRAHDIELSGNEIRFSQDQGIFAEDSTSRLQILGNRIHDNGRRHVSGQHQSHGIYVEGRDHLIANNVISSHPYGFGIQIYPSNRGTIVVHNTVVGSGHSGIVVGGDGGVGNITIRNNILAFNDGYGIEADSDCPVSTVMVDTNVIYGNGDGQVERGCGTINSSGGNIGSDPKFVARSQGNLQLRSGSPAIDKARADFSTRTDIRGYKRPLGGGFDVGAYERAG
jgi:hypothetical protein